MGDLAQEDSARSRRELQVLHARRVVDHDHRAITVGMCWMPGALSSSSLFMGSVGGAEVHRLLGDLLDPAPEPDRLVV